MKQAKLELTWIGKENRPKLEPRILVEDPEKSHHAPFRTGKSDLKIRPIWHQLEHRVQAHILFSFLAYALWKTLQIWMQRSGLGRGVRTVLEEFARIKANDVILRTSAGREVKLCCITHPDCPQQALIDRLGLMIPERLGRPRWIPDPQKLNRDVV